MRVKYGVGIAIRAVGPGLLLALAACAIPDASQVQLPRVDWSSFVPTNTNQYVGQQRGRGIGADDFVDAGGQCPGAAAPVASEQSVPTAPAAPVAPTAPAAPVAAPAIRGVGLEMTECEVVRAAGSPESVQIGTNERGERSVTMIYGTPERPTYRFVAGRLVSIERGAEPPPEPAKKKPPPKKQAKKPQAT